MKAVVINEHGGTEAMKYTDFPDPVVGPGEVLIEVKACALNHLDLWVRRGLPGIEFKFPHILGCDVSGIVKDLGQDVTNVKSGDRVLVSPGVSCMHCQNCLMGRDNLCRYYSIVGYARLGGYAQYLKIPSVNAVPIPEKLTFEEAAAVPLVFLTAWHMLVNRAKLRAGETVLVHAAGSGVGSAAIQIGKLLNARVLATASTDEKLAKALELGADEIINYTEKDFATEVRRLTSKRGVDVVVEHTGVATWEKSISSLGVNGRLVTCGATTGYQAQLDLRHLFARHLNLLGSYMGEKHELLEVLKFFHTGQLRAVVDRVLPLSDAAIAHNALEDRRQFGKVVLIP
ncbi:MAG: zinc-binding dehydrogenase [Pyrinomonadaceae bacterium]